MTTLKSKCCKADVKAECDYEGTWYYICFHCQKPCDVEKQKKAHTATWTAIENPLYFIHCPNCNHIIFTSSPTVIERLKKWAGQFLKRKK